MVEAWGVGAHVKRLEILNTVAAGRLERLTYVGHRLSRCFSSMLAHARIATHMMMVRVYTRVRGLITSSYFARLLTPGEVY